MSGLYTVISIDASSEEHKTQVSDIMHSMFPPFTWPLTHIMISRFQINVLWPYKKNFDPAGVESVSLRSYTEDVRRNERSQVRVKSC